MSGFFSQDMTGEISQSQNINVKILPVPDWTMGRFRTFHMGKFTMMSYVLLLLPSRKGRGTVLLQLCPA